MFVFLIAICAVLIWIISRRRLTAKNPARPKLAPQPLRPARFPAGRFGPLGCEPGLVLRRERGLIQSGLGQGR